jgi:hypothetical protein
VLHSVAQLVISVPDVSVRLGEDLLHILEGELVPLHSLKGLGPSHEGLDIVAVGLEDGRAVFNGTIEVGNLLEAGGAVGEGLRGYMSD